VIKKLDKSNKNILKEKFKRF